LNEKPDAAKLLKIQPLDREIWEDELDSFVPVRLYDMHAHLTRYELNLDPDKANTRRYQVSSGAFAKHGSLELLQDCEKLLYPGRHVTHMLAATPFPQCHFEASNEFIAAEARKEPNTTAQMVVHPQMRAVEVEEMLIRHRFVGLKPYMHYSPTQNKAECRITDFMPDHQLALANQYGSIIRLHLSKSLAIADPENLDDLERLTYKYPQVRWVLAHCARSYSDWPLARAASRLVKIPNLWYESSSVCETDAFDALFSTIEHSRICYGSDDFTVGVTRGKYVAWGYCWSQLDEENQTLSQSHCQGGFTFVRYEMLRAMRRAAHKAGYTEKQIEDIFYNNASNLVRQARNDLERAL
jgi:glutamate-1-semialdehyde 2,1-aminomutase